jgi:hypothetical protein
MKCELFMLKGTITFGPYGATSSSRLIKLAPPPLKRIRPATPLKPLAAKLLVVGMGWRR